MAIQKMKGIVREEVIVKDLFLHMIRIQIFERDEEGDGQVEECYQREDRLECG